MAAPRRVVTSILGLSALLLTLAPSASSSVEAPLQRAIERLTTLPDGPPGVIVLVQRGPNLRVFRAGVADVATGAPMEPWKHMRIASTAKAYSGGVALTLVEDGLLSLDHTIGELLPWAPRAWSEVTLAQALHHTSGLPDFSADRGFQTYLVAHLEEPLGPRRLLGFVADEGLLFDPGSEYRYSNSDNVVVGLMAMAVTGHHYDRVLWEQVLRPLRLRHTSLPRGTRMPTPLIRGYDFEDDGTPEDVSELVAAGWAWASGGVVSTPLDQNRFIRGYVGRRLFGAATRAEQFDFIPGGSSEPPGPGGNSAGLAIFRYRTSCGTMFGHTGNTLGYTQFMAASRDGSRSVVVAINSQATPDLRPEVFEQLRGVFRLAVCEALGG